jgi:ABC-type transport system involved in Fe-S cluster assembly fused permease/ATPase subunit
MKPWRLAGRLRRHANPFVLHPGSNQLSTPFTSRIVFADSRCFTALRLCSSGGGRGPPTEAPPSDHQRRRRGRPGRDVGLGKESEEPPIPAEPELARCDHAVKRAECSICNRDLTAHKAHTTPASDPATADPVGGDKKTSTPERGNTTSSSGGAGGVRLASFKDAFMFLIPHLWPKGRADHKMRILTLLSFALGSKIFFVTVPFYFKAIIDHLVNHQKVAAAGGAAETVASEASVPGAASAAADVVTDEATNSFAVETAMSVAEGVFGTGIFALVAAYGVTRASASLMAESRMALFTKVGADAYKNINESLLLKMLGLELDYHLSRKTGAVTKVLDRGSRAFASMAWCLLFVFIPTGFEMGLVCLLLQNQVGGQFVLVAVSAVLSYIAFTTKVTNWRAQFRDAYNEQETKCSSMVVDCLLNYETVKYFRNEQHEAQRLRSANEVLTHNLIRLDQTMCGLNFGQQFIFITAATTSMFFASQGVLAGSMTVGDLVLVDALLLQLYTPLSWLGVVYREMTTATQDMRAMLDLLQRPSKMIDAPSARPFKYGDGTIELRRASFAYGEKRVLDDVTLTIPGGSLAAFVGPSGTGKTTIFRLLFRFMQLDSGEILIDGQPVGSVTIDSLREHLGVVPQDTVMFNDTIGYNIRYGKLGATHDDVQRVARAAAVDAAIARMDSGYDTVVGERGLKLSGGEKQRVAIARVLLQDPDIILADEATSALDTHTEAAVIETLRQAPSGRRRTVVMIAHRLATVRNCDIIFVLGHDGRVVEQGSHDELLEAGGLYHHLWSRQASTLEDIPGIQGKAAGNGGVLGSPAPSGTISDGASSGR